MRPPECEICGSRFEPTVGGDLVRFRPDDRSTAWRARAEAEKFVGHPPDIGWFCRDHLDAARRVAPDFSLPDGLRLVRTGLADLDLGSGRAGVEAALDEQWVEWDLQPLDAGELYTAMRAMVPSLYDAVGLGAVPSLVEGRDRDWTPMDGAQPPHCPFTDRFTVRGGDLAVVMQFEHWDDDAVHSASVTLSVGRAVYVSAFGSNGAGRVITRLRLYRPLTADAVRLVSTLAG